MDIRGALIIAIVCSILLVAINKAHADEPSAIAESPPAPTEMYMPNQVDGFLTLYADPCRIPVIEHEYPFKAINADDQGNEMEGCWNQSDMSKAPGNAEPYIHVFMYEEGSANVASFKQHLFSAEKKRWPEITKTCDGCGTM